jgi:hypothetical protein
VNRIDTAIEIDAPPAAVWAVLRDFESYPEWNPFVRIVGRPNPGARLRVTLTPPGRSSTTFRPTVIAHERDRELRWRGSLGLRGLYDGEHRLLLEPVDDGARTRFVHDETFSGLLVGPINLLVGESTRRGFEAMNEALKARVEWRAATGARDGDATANGTGTPTAA